jgi:hypothetical protein
MKQDDPENKPHSLVADFTMVGESVKKAYSGIQLRKLFI